MGDHHVPIGSGLLVEAGALAEGELLRHIDLYVVDEVAVPDRLEQAVGETEGENVLRRLLAEKMIDAEDPFLVEHLVQLGIERHRALKIGAEGLLHDDARALDQTGVSQQAHRRQGGTGRHAEIVQPAAFRVERALRLQHRRLEGGGTRGQRHVMQARCKGIPVGLGHLARGELRERIARQLAKAVRVQILQRDADDPAVRDEPSTHQMKQPRQQLASGKIARGAHQNHDLGLLRAHTRRYFCHTRLL